MKQFYIYSNEHKDPDGKIYERVKSYLLKLGVTVCEKGNDAECILVLGGDGTLISAADKFSSDDIVFVGVNLGTIGYLADIEMESLEESLNQLIIDDFVIEERLMLRGNISTADGNNISAVALNDVVINRTGSLCVIEYGIFVNDEYLTSLRADGIIVATPTGSTGYSLSAGGPIVDPKSHLMVITPICPQSLSSRPIILSAESSIRIEVMENPYTKTCVEASFDGKDNKILNPGESVNIVASKRTTKIGKIKKESFVEIMRHKLGNS